MRRANTLRFLAVVAFVALPILAFPQAAGTARPIRPVPVSRSPIGADDAPSGMYFLFGNAALAEAVLSSSPSTVDTGQMERNLKDLLDLHIPIAGAFSLGGLLTNGVTDGGKTMTARLELWRTFYDARVKFPIHYVFGSEALGAEGTLDPNAVKAWLKATGQGDQATADLAWNQGRDRMVMIDAEVPGGVNLAWLTAEMAKDKDDKNIDRVFVFGSRPLVAPEGIKLLLKNQAFATAENTVKARKLLAANPKVVGYFCGSPGMFAVTSLETNSKVKQVVVGNTAGDLDRDWTLANGRSYGFTLLVAYASGKVSIVPFKRAQTSGSEAQAPPPTPAVGMNEIVIWERPAK